MIDTFGPEKPTTTGLDNLVINRDAEKLSISRAATRAALIEAGESQEILTAHMKALYDSVSTDITELSRTFDPLRALKALRRFHADHTKAVAVLNPILTSTEFHQLASFGGGRAYLHAAQQCQELTDLAGKYFIRPLLGTTITTYASEGAKNTVTIKNIALHDGFEPLVETDHGHSFTLSSFIRIATDPKLAAPKYNTAASVQQYISYVSGTTVSHIQVTNTTDDTYQVRILTEQGPEITYRSLPAIEFTVRYGLDKNGYKTLQVIRARDKSLQGQPLTKASIVTLLNPHKSTKKENAGSAAWWQKGANLLTSARSIARKWLNKLF
ncbi:MAG: hypothetical protein HY817_03325 [Candidatus Abawacabacteria bacterium]|nr:hypothetical protein [Candidatus Abawacabacteria bacterium]